MNKKKQGKWRVPYFEWSLVYIRSFRTENLQYFNLISAGLFFLHTEKNRIIMNSPGIEERLEILEFLMEFLLNIPRGRITRRKIDVREIFDFQRIKLML